MNKKQNKLQNKNVNGMTITLSVKSRAGPSRRSVLTCKWETIEEEHV